MASVNLEIPFEAYRGDEPYIFVSYAHKDGELVYPLLGELREMGCRVWFDEGIDPGNEWPEEIAKALLKAAHFLVFLTGNAIGSKNVKSEINYAIDEDKPFLAVHLEEMKLPPGLALRMGGIQAILKWRMSSDHYRRALRRALPDTLRGQVPVAPSEPEPPISRPAPVVTRKAGDIETVELGGGVKLELVWCPAGSFWMGSPESEAERFDNETRHRVTLTKGFWLGRYEVTQGQWMAVMGSNPSNFKGVDSLPVEYVSWKDCQEFCRKLSVKMPRGGAFRLPTEAEWEYACRAGTETAFHYGNRLDATMANFDGDYPYGGAAKREYREETVPVGSFHPNGWGLYDMHGNVWEWCSDWYGAYPSGDAVDPPGVASGSSRVLRGGGWCDNARYCRSAVRGNNTSSFRNDVIGFRVARILP